MPPPVPRAGVFIPLVGKGAFDVALDGCCSVGDAITVTRLRVGGAPDVDPVDASRNRLARSTLAVEVVLTFRRCDPVLGRAFGGLLVRSSGCFPFADARKSVGVGLGIISPQPFALTSSTGSKAFTGLALFRSWFGLEKEAIDRMDGASVEASDAFLETPGRRCGRRVGETGAETALSSAGSFEVDAVGKASFCGSSELFLRR